MSFYCQHWRYQSLEYATKLHIWSANCIETTNVSKLIQLDTLNQSRCSLFGFQCNWNNKIHQPWTISFHWVINYYQHVDVSNIKPYNPPPPPPLSLYIYIYIYITQHYMTLNRTKRERLSHIESIKCTLLFTLWASYGAFLLVPQWKMTSRYRECIVLCMELRMRRKDPWYENEACLPDYYRRKQANTLDAWTLKRQYLHFDEIFVTGYTGSCQNENFQCSQWWKFRQNNDFSVAG